MSPKIFQPCLAALLPVLLAVLAFLPLAAGPSYAQPTAAASVSTPRIDGFDVAPVARPLPGNELPFTLYGSPGGTAAVRIDGATGTAVLQEGESGVYEGSYTIRKRDRINAQSKATANLRVGNTVASAILDEPLVGLPRPASRRPAAHVAGAPWIERFDVDAPQRLEAGEELKLTLVGSPGGSASATIAGVKGKLVLDEVRSGVYEGSYTIKSRDRIADDARVVGNLRVGNRDSSALLDHSLGGRSASATRQTACADCGVVEAINVVEVKGEGSYLGKIAGGVAGALLGSQIGSGRGTTVAEVAGAAGGVFAGNEIEKRIRTRKHYEVLVRLDNGGTKSVAYAERPGFAVGTRVRVENGRLAVVP